MFDTEIVIVEINVEIRKDQLLLDELPDDASHFIAIELYNGSLNFDLAHQLFPSSSCEKSRFILTR